MAPMTTSCPLVELDATAANQSLLMASRDDVDSSCIKTGTPSNTTSAPHDSKLPSNDNRASAPPRPALSSVFVDNVGNKRRLSQSSTPVAPPTKRVRQKVDDDKENGEGSIHQGYRTTATSSDPSYQSTGSTLIYGTPISPEDVDDAQTSSTNNLGPPLNSEQQRVVDLILQGRNTLYTGPAGSGKSVILRSFVEKLQQKEGKQVDVIASTNLSTCTVDGQTLWSYAGWKRQDYSKSLNKLVAPGHDTIAWKRMCQTDVLVIVDVSMLANHQLERLSAVMKAAREGLAGSDKPFGGVQVVATGDVRTCCSTFSVSDFH
jgi:ATP-dependent DNA helicase PIF1